MAAILIVEDEVGISTLIKRTFDITGHKSFQAFRGKEALKLMEQEKIDLILLDINLPDMNGFEIMEQVGEIPVICVTAKDKVSDKVKGLYGGAQDYITKPFDMEELLARVSVVLKRFHKEQVLYSFSDIKIDTKQYKVYKQDRLIELTSREYKLLVALVQNKNIALSRNRLLDIAWEMDFDGEERTVDVHIQRLRKKLELDNQIKTIFKYGYRLEI